MFFLSGLAAFYSFAPFTIWPILTIGLAGVYLTYRDRKRNIKTFLFALGYHIGLLYWLYFPFLIDGSYNLITVIIAVFTACSILSFMFCMMMYISVNLKHSPFIFASSGVFSEYFFCEVLIKIIIGSGFPWCYTGYALASNIYIAQSAYLFKIYGLSFFIYYFAAHIAKYVETKEIKHIKIIIALSLTLLTYGVYRAHYEKNYFTIKNQFTIVQPNHKQKTKWAHNSLERRINELVQLSTSKNNIIWPEACIPYVFSEYKNIISKYMSSPLHKDKFLISGVIFHHEKKFFNSLVIINSNGEILHRYDKNILAPFGEFTPFRDIAIIKMLLGDKNEYSTGIEREIIKLPGTDPFLPLICYEIIFPNINPEPAKLIINITNDAWFGNTNAPYQHLAITRIRAIENNVHIIRVANTGISAYIDNLGRILKKIKLNKKGTFNV